MDYMHRETGKKGEAARKILQHFIDRVMDTKWKRVPYEPDHYETSSHHPVKSRVVKKVDPPRVPRPRKESRDPSPFDLTFDPDISLEFPGVTFEPPTKIMEGDSDVEVESCGSQLGDEPGNPQVPETKETQTTKETNKTEKAKNKDKTDKQSTPQKKIDKDQQQTEETDMVAESQENPCPDLGSIGATIHLNDDQARVVDRITNQMTTTHSQMQPEVTCSIPATPTIRTTTPALGESSPVITAETQSNPDDSRDVRMVVQTNSNEGQEPAQSETEEEREIRREQRRQRKAEKRKRKQEKEGIAEKRIRTDTLLKDLELSQSDDNQPIVTSIDNRLEEEEKTLNELETIRDKKVILNIGGRFFTTSVPTMLQDPKSKFALVFRKKTPTPTEYFFDRDAGHFRFILNYLRDQCRIKQSTLPRERKFLLELLNEAEYYGLGGLQEIVKRRLQQFSDLGLDE
ncbi:MAG: hypothetical protein N0E48_03305 [Candidatus Thiodiazotropha endolucinida]|nr:hypothetical protein [Candidatus Thiodiazotropha taylori]MCW4342389.1 hypothetical protein [Candidatus Thiodiazotropha endolucinida]